MNLSRRIYLIITLFIYHTNSSANDIKTAWLDNNNSRTWTIAKTFIDKPTSLSKQKTLLHETEIIFNGDEVTRTFREVNYYPTFNETHSNGNKNIYWDKEVETLTILEARTLSLDGESHRLDTKNIRVLDSDSYNTFTDQKQVVLPYSGLKDKSLSILEYQIKFSLSKLESPWSTIIYPIIFDPVDEFRLNIFEDKSKPLLWQNITNDAIKCKQVDLKLSCTGSNLEPSKSDTDVIWRDVLPQIIVSRKFTWNEIISNNLKAFNKSDNQSDAVKKILGEIIKPKMSQEEKITAIHKFVSRDIRYISMSELGHRITPHTATSVLKNRFGDCKDKSALLHGMLSLIGIKSTPVLVATERSNTSQQLLPSDNYFDHIVICFDLNSQHYCLDPTDTSTDYSTISSWIQGKLSLALEKDAKLSSIPKSEYKWKINVITNLNFDEKSQLIEKQKRIYEGEYASYLRGSLAHENEETRLDALSENYHNVVSASVQPTFKLTNLKEMKNTLIIQSEANFPKFLDPEKGLNYTENDSWVTNEIKQLEIQTKYYDAKVLGLNITSNVNIDFNNLWNITWHSPKLNLKGKFGEMSRSVNQIAKDKINIQTNVKISSQTIMKSEINQFNDFLEMLKTESAMTFDGSTNNN